MAIGLYIRGAFAANARGCKHCLRGARASHSSGRIEGCYAGGVPRKSGRAHDSLKNRRCATSACVCRALRAGGCICTPSAFAAVCRKLWARGNGRGCAAISEECRKIEGRLGIAGTAARVSSFGCRLPPVVTLSAAPRKAVRIRACPRLCARGYSCTVCALPHECGLLCVSRGRRLCQKD